MEIDVYDQADFDRVHGEPEVQNIMHELNRDGRNCVSNMRDGMAGLGEPPVGAHLTYSHVSHPSSGARHEVRIYQTADGREVKYVANGYPNSGSAWVETSDNRHRDSSRSLDWHAANDNGERGNEESHAWNERQRDKGCLAIMILLSSIPTLALLATLKSLYS